MQHCPGNHQVQNKHFLRDLATDLYSSKSGGIYFILIALALHGFLTTQGILFLISWWFSDIPLVLFVRLVLVAAVHFLPGERSMEQLCDCSVCFRTDI